MAKKFKLKKTHKVSSEEKAEKRKKFLFSIFLAFIMFFSIFSISLYYSGEGKSKFNGHTFSLEQDGEDYFLVTKIDGEKIPFYTQPEVSSQLNGEGNLTKFFNEANYFIFTSNPNNNLSINLDYIRYEFNNIMTEKKILSGVDAEYEGYENSQIITCENATNSVKTIHFIESNETLYNVNNNCLEFYVEPKEIIYVRDRMLLSIYKIVNE